MLARATMGTARSAAFLGVFVIIYQSACRAPAAPRRRADVSAPAYFCTKHNLHACLRPHPLARLLIAKGSFWLGGVLAGAALLLEARHRRPELAMYVLPKALESVWRMARGRGLVAGPARYGEGIVRASAVWPAAQRSRAPPAALRARHGHGHGEHGAPRCVPTLLTVRARPAYVPGAWRRAVLVCCR